MEVEVRKSWPYLICFSLTLRDSAIAQINLQSDIKEVLSTLLRDQEIKHYKTKMAPSVKSKELVIPYVHVSPAPEPDSSAVISQSMPMAAMFMK